MIKRSGKFLKVCFLSGHEKNKIEIRRKSIIVLKKSWMESEINMPKRNEGGKLGNKKFLFINLIISFIRVRGVIRGGATPLPRLTFIFYDFWTKNNIIPKKSWFLLAKTPPPQFTGEFSPPLPIKTLLLPNSLSWSYKQD